jgi:hypothetical protein
MSKRLKDRRVRRVIQRKPPVNSQADVDLLQRFAALQARIQEEPPVNSQAAPLPAEPESEPDLRLLASSPEASIEDLLQGAEDFPEEVLRNPRLADLQETDPERYREIIGAAWISLGEASLAEGISSLNLYDQVLFLFRCVDRVLPLYQTLYPNAKSLQSFLEIKECLRSPPAQVPGAAYVKPDETLLEYLIRENEVQVDELANGYLTIERYASCLDEISEILAEFQEHKQLEGNLLEQAARQAAIALLSYLCFVLNMTLVYVDETIEAIMSAIYLQSLGAGKSQDEARKDVLTELEEQKKIITSLLG